MNTINPRPLDPSPPLGINPASPPSQAVGLLSRLSINRQKALPILAAGAMLLLIGLVYFGSVFLKPRKESVTSDEATVNSLSPPQAKTANSGSTKDGKYSLGYRANRLNPSRATAEAEAQSRLQTEQLTGQSMGASRSFHTNEGVALPAEAAVSTLATPAYRPPSKTQTAQSVQADLRRQNRENQQVMRTLYASPETPQERAARLAVDEEKRFNRTQQQRLMSLSERAIEQQLGNRNGNLPGGVQSGSTSPSGQSVETQTDEPLQLDTYYRLKAMSKGNLTPYQQRLFAREMAADQRGEAGISTAVVDPGSSLQTHTVSEEGVGFISTGGHRVAPSQNASTRNLSIPAVIHGDADAVVVRTGGTVTIRLTQDTQLLLNGERVVLAAHSLVAGICQINGERVQIRVTNIRQGAYLYTTDLLVYDLDGQAGLRVPNLTDKTQAGQTLVQAGTQSASNPMMLIPQGSAVNQIGTQVGVQAASSLFSGLRQLAVSKLSSAKVTIRPNYQIFLKAGSSNGPRRSSKSFVSDEE